MLTIPNEVMALFQTDGVHKNFHVHFPNAETTDINNENLLQESVKFTESLCSQEYFKFGLAESSQLEFTAVGIPNILGVTIECGIEIDCTSLGAAWASSHPVNPSLDFLVPQTCNVGAKLYYRVPYGRFIVDSCPRDHNVMFNRKVTAYSEKPFSDKQLIVGQYPVNYMKVNPMEWFEAQNIKTSTMEHFTWVKTDKFYWIISAATGAYLSNGSDCLERINGVSYAAVRTNKYDEGSVASFRENPNPGTNYKELNCNYALRINYQPHEFDEYGKSFYDAAMASLPSGAFIYGEAYNSGGTRSWLQYYSNVKETVFSLSGILQPCYYIVEVWNHSDGRQFNRRSRPIYIQSGETYILDFLHREETFSFYLKPPAGFTYISDVNLYVHVPMRWSTNGSWSKLNTITTITGWSTAAPFGGETEVERDGNVDIYLKALTANTSFPPFVVNNTLAFSKCSGSGTYYTFANAISLLGISQGYMELLGAFWRINRSGSFEQFDIGTDSDLYNPTLEQIMELWWDENDVDPIGVVYASFGDENSSEASVASFVIGNGLSVYSMEENDMIKNTVASQSAIQTVIATYFAPNASVINFTPAELSMKGMPFLESGDKLSIVAYDGTVVNTYILEQTISGIQHLVADITSTNGSVLEVTEE